MASGRSGGNPVRGAALVDVSPIVLPKATKHDARRRNLRTALQVVYREGVTSRARIARITGLTRAAASDLVSELVRDGLVMEAGLGTSSGGKPPTLLALHARGREIVAIDLSRRPFRGALLDLEGSVTRQVAGRRGSMRGDRGVAEVFHLVESLVEAATSPILGIGVGTPGIVDPDGAVAEAANLDWHGVPLQDDIATRFGLPVEVANDAHVAALAEFGSRPGDNLALVKVGVGIGAGLVVNGQLYRGDRPAAGEIGHIRVVDRGLRCTCGNTGCLETVASVPSILRQAASNSGAGEPRPGPLPWNVAPLSSAFGADAVLAAVSTAGRHLGAVLAHVVGILDVHRIAVSLELEGAELPFLEAVRAEVRARVLPSLASVIQISPTARGEDLVLAGAAALVLNEHLGVTWG